MGILKNIYWDGADKNTIVHKFDIKNDQLNKGSVVTVREGQAAIFCHRGKMADVFLPGFYKLDTNSIPLLTKLMSWKYGFENAVRCDIYFVNTHQFTNQKWGTVNPILVRDKDFGAVEIRGYGTYAFKIDDPYIFMQEVAGSHPSFRTQEITDMIKSRVISGLTRAIGESKIPVLDMAGNVMALSEDVVKYLQGTFKDIGIKITNFTFENFSMPEELQKALRENTAMGMKRQNFDMHLAQQQMDVMKTAAANPGSGGFMNPMMGMGMGVSMGHAMGNMMGQQMQNVAGFGGQPGNFGPGATGGAVKCDKCGESVGAGIKFCPHCGDPMGEVCPKCKAAVKPGAKFCPDCGQSLVLTCPKCGVTLPAGTKFCGECGAKI